MRGAVSDRGSAARRTGSSGVDGWSATRQHDAETTD